MLQEVSKQASSGKAAAAAWRRHLSRPCMQACRLRHPFLHLGLLLVLCCQLSAPASALLLAKSTTQSVSSSKPLSPPRPPPSHITAALKAAREAQEVLHNTTQSREADAASALLNNATLRQVSLPTGSQAWCPMLRLSATSQREPNPLSLATLINSHYHMKSMTWKAAMSDDLAAVAVAGLWWSGKARPVPVTLITQASVDRLPQLYHQCKSWAGPLSAVMFLGLFQESVGNLTAANAALLKKAALMMSNLFAVLETDESACKLDIMLVYEVYTERQCMMLYPINVLRNYARLQAQTPLLALVDVDMLMGSRLYADLLADPAFSKSIVDAASARTAFVLPAFETDGPVYEAAALADVLASRDKQFLIDSIAKQVVGPFDHKRFPQGHNWTLFDRWYAETRPYQVTYGPRYEPWTIVDRRTAPWHDVRFRGYGQNKIVHIALLNSTGTKFVVLPNAFIIHRSHQPTTIRQRLVASKTVYDVALMTKQSVDRTSIYGHTKALYDDARQLMDVGKFQPVLDPATKAGIAELSWWKG